MIKAEHAGDTCSAFSDVVNFVVSGTQDFAGSAVVVDVPGVRVNHLIRHEINEGGSVR